VVYDKLLFHERQSQVKSSSALLQNGFWLHTLS